MGKRCLPHHLFPEIFFPARCAACGVPVTARQNHICPACAASITPLRDGCQACSGSIAEGVCGICRDRHWYPAKSITVTEYRGAVASVIRALKFDKIRSLYKIIASLALEPLITSGIRAEIVTWVPMNAKKRWERGFNQSELIARYIAKKSGLPARALLRERRNAPTQRELGLRGRILNSLGRYRPVRDVPYGKAVLLVDDVLTTGATINECARQLLMAGAREIFSLTIARADIKRLEMF
ncbi:MAG: ComF family protein [Chrysiogenales bacterium]|nr:MAG: ComF family protein [Chrysiogenales bacterium]